MQHPRKRYSSSTQVARARGPRYSDLNITQAASVPEPRPSRPTNTLWPPSLLLTCSLCNDFSLLYPFATLNLWLLKLELTNIHGERDVEHGSNQKGKHKL